MTRLRGIPLCVAALAATIVTIIAGQADGVDGIVGLVSPPGATPPEPPNRVATVRNAAQRGREPSPTTRRSGSAANGEKVGLAPRLRHDLPSNRGAIDRSANNIAVLAAEAWRHRRRSMTE